MESMNQTFVLKILIDTYTPLSDTPSARKQLMRSKALKVLKAVNFDPRVYMGAEHLTVSRARQSMKFIFIDNVMGVLIAFVDQEYAKIYDANFYQFPSIVNTENIMNILTIAHAYNYNAQEDEHNHVKIPYSSIMKTVIKFIERITTAQRTVSSKKEFKKAIKQINPGIQSKQSALRGLIGHTTEVITTEEQIEKQWEDTSRAIKEFLKLSQEEMEARIANLQLDPVDKIGRRLAILIDSLKNEFHQLHIKIGVRFFGRQIKAGEPDLLAFTTVMIPSNKAFTLMSTQQIEPFLRLVREQIKQKIIRHIERIQLCGSGYSIDGIASFDIKYAIIPFGGCGHKFKKEKYGKYKGINWPNECKEQLCFWRCLAMFTCKDEIKLITDPKGKEQRIKAKELHDKHSPIPENLVNIAMLDKISESTNLNIIVYSIQPAVKESVVQKLTQIYMSQIYEDRKTIELVLAEEEHHYGWLRSKEGVITERQCQFCFKKFSDKTKNTSALKEHEKRCLAKKSISDAKEELTFHEKRIRKFKSVSHKYLHEDLQRQYYISYDFETLNVKHTEQLSQGETLCALPKAIGYSMMLHEFSKEHGEFKPVTELDEFRFPIEYVGTDCAKHLVDQLCKFKPLLEANLKQKMIEKQVEWGTSLEYLECKNPKHNKDCSCARDKAKGKIIHEFMTVPVYGYNSGGFDIYLMLKSMSRFNFSDVQYRDGVYTKLRVDDFYDFVDAHALVPPSVNLERFGQLFSSQRIHKELFPYDWMDDERKLSETKFPPYNVFYNRLKNESPKKSDYILHKMLFEHDKKLTFGKYVALSLGFCDREINTKEELIQDIGEEKTKGIIWDHLVEDYTRAIKDYSKINTMKDYMMFYCTRDVELLAEGMNGYYKLLKKEDGFDILKFTTIASLAERIAYVNYIKTPIYSIPNKKCYDMARDSLFGGNCQVFQKKLEDNGNFKASFDANSLYPSAMRCSLPTSMGLDIDKEDMDDLNNADLIHYREDCPICKKDICPVIAELEKLIKDKSMFEGFSESYLWKFRDFNCHYGYVTCQIQFNREQKNRVHKFPVIPEMKKIDPADFNDLMHQQKDTLEYDYNKVYNGSDKIIYDLKPKTVTITTPYLYQLLEYDLVTVVKIEKYCETKTDRFMKEFVEARAAKRQKGQDMINNAKNEAERQAGESKKELNKLISNSSYGRFELDERKYGNIGFCSSSEEFCRLISRGRLDDFKILAADSSEGSLVQVNTRKAKQQINVPIYVGSWILWNSKMIMNDFVYGVLLKYYPNTIIAYGDTDSVKIEVPGIKTEEEFYSIFPEEIRQKYFPGKGDVTLGKMKIEYQIQKAIYLKAKSYSEVRIIGNGLVDKAKNKGVRLNQNKERLKYEFFNDVWEHWKAMTFENFGIKKRDFADGKELAFVLTRKFGLDPFDDKRMLINKSGETRPYGFYDDDEKETTKIAKHLYYRHYERIKNHVKKWVNKTFLWSEQMILIRDIMLDFRKYFGVTNMEFLEHIRKQLKRNWTLENYGKEWELDHILPCNELKKSEEPIKTLEALIYYKNLQPLSISENRSKKDKINEPKDQKKEDRKEERSPNHSTFQLEHLDLLYIQTNFFQINNSDLYGIRIKLYLQPLR
eukprot:TRINITY_DN1351_c0_g1_i17.p1 TRINITY_DN1351_c0_g1~~TRINITY_DN1351_c0_g1_i17.p1  ORF type:complete len:1616 (+),score=141.18 TRINITY_DN1351_c0_g1_i17:188-5035(+)